jgi:hypothetical protein
MSLSVEPTYSCIAVRHASEMGPHREPPVLHGDLRKVRGKRRPGAGERRPAVRERRPWGVRATTPAALAPAPDHSPGHRMVFLGRAARPSLDHAAIVCAIGACAGVLAGVLGFITGH